METIRTIRHDITLDLNEVMYLTPVGDVHEDARAHHKKKFTELLERRVALPNSYFISNGDLKEYIGPGDHRDVASIVRGDDDAWIDRDVERSIERYKPYNFLAIGEGNHESKATKACGTNPAERLAAGLGVPFGGYAYRLILRLFDRSSNKGSRATCRILVNHGNWGGAVAKGLSGAINWAKGYPGWDIFIYGHNHASISDIWDREETQTSGRVYCGPQAICANGTFLQGATKKNTTYSARGGYGPVFIGCPLITVQLKRNRIGIEIANGNIR